MFIGIEQIWDFISLIVLALVAYPIIRYIETFEYIYLHMIISIALCLAIVKITRHLPPKYKFMMRPNSAQNCSILNKGGSYANKIGMPSGHMLTASFIITFLYLMDPSPTKAIVGLLTLIAIGTSRYYKNCHTIPQICIGIISGMILAYLSFMLL